MSFNPFLNSSSGGGSGEAGKDGRGIVSIAFSSSNKGDVPNLSGAIDTYEILYTDNTESTINVYNGLDGKNGVNGTNGKEVELKVSDEAIQWKYSGDTTWVNLLLLSDIKGSDGQSVSLRTNNNYIQWKKDNETEWTNLISLSELKGADGFSPTIEITPIDGGNKLDITDTAGTKTLQILNGTNGKEIEIGKDDINLKWRYVGDSSWKVLVPLSSLKGTDGTNGTDGISITSISFTSSDKGDVAGLAGATDTYTITLSNNTTSTFLVYNGKDGSGGSSSGFSGDYNDLINKPTIPTVSNDLTDELKEHYDLAYSQTHTHNNKAILDALSEDNSQELTYNSENVYRTKILTKTEYDSEKTAGTLKDNWIYVVSDEVDTPQLEDSGWNTLAVSADGVGYSESKIKYRKIGKVVYIEGYLNVKENQNNTPKVSLIGILPTGFRPTKAAFGINTSPLTDGNNALHNSFIKIKSSGEMLLVNTGESLTTDLHYFLNVSYLID